MVVQKKIEQKIKGVFSPVYFLIENESHRHNVPPDSETHFKVVVVSSAFQGRTLVDRHRLVFGLLNDEMKGGVHALALHTFTPEEWPSQMRKFTSPPCLGGSEK
jgi:BolA protein